MPAKKKPAAKKAVQSKSKLKADMKKESRQKEEEVVLPSPEPNRGLA